MQTTRKSTLAAGALILAGLLGVGATPARAQAVSGGAYRGNYPGYYYSPGGYSGGYYFTPGYYRTPGYSVSSGPSGVGATGRGYFGSSTAVGTTQPPKYRDYTTGRTNLAVPLAKPWLRPLR